MGRFLSKILVLLAVALVLANAGCFARCVVQSCQDTPPPCHSHGKSDSHCPQQNQMKAAASSALTLDSGMAFVLADWPAQITIADPPDSSTVLVATPSCNVSAPPLALRI